MQNLKHDKWKGTTGGTPWMQKALVSMLRVVGVRPLYCVMACVVPFYMIFNPKGFSAVHYLFRRRLGWSPLKSFAAVWRNHYAFGQVIIDRFAVYAGRHYDFEVVGGDAFFRLLEGESGIVMFSSHVGNYELAGYSLKTADKPFSALVFGGETQTVMDNRARAFGRNNVRMIPVSEDMSHIFALNEAVSEGGIASMPSDRLFGSSKAVRCSFLGREADFPLGPFAFAVQKAVPVVAMFVMKTGAYRYKAYPYVLDVPASGDRRERARMLAGEYVDRLEKVVREYPWQWFNYFDFWGAEDSPRLRK
ncbi:MAG: hypothetical protein ACI3ZL_02730 [Candidatus Cryptobacteroides sp.]